MVMMGVEGDVIVRGCVFKFGGCKRMYIVV